MSTQREDFTSEIFKIEIKNLAKFGFGVRSLNLKVMCMLIWSIFFLSAGAEEVSQKQDESEPC